LQDILYLLLDIPILRWIFLYFSFLIHTMESCIYKEKACFSVSTSRGHEWTFQALQTYPGQLTHIFQSVKRLSSVCSPTNQQLRRRQRIMTLAIMELQCYCYFMTVSPCRKIPRKKSVHAASSLDKITMERKPYNNVTIRTKMFSHIFSPHLKFLLMIPLFFCCNLEDESVIICWDCCKCSFFPKFFAIHPMPHSD